ncbi:DUF59 domain-containing protein [candidate division WOR-3 bacterium]|nr:DUF59 domain-containing protein [candidate division WOR-3 bacterium]
MKKFSQADINQALSKVMHPEVRYSLVDLGIIKEVVAEENKVSFILNLPFLEIPIKDYLIQIIKEALTNLDKDVEVEIKLEQMNQRERDEFMKKAKEGWKF